MAIGTQMQQRRALDADWNISNYVLAQGELGVTLDTGIIKIGDGVNTWSNLPIAFEEQYLPLLGTAANSALLEGISSSGFLQTSEAHTDAAANSIAKRSSAGRLKAVAGASTDDVINFDQVTQQLLDNKKETFDRSFTDATTDITLQLTDVNSILIAINNSLTVRRNVYIPNNTAAAFPIGVFIDICNDGTGILKLIPGSGVTIRGHLIVYGAGSVIRLIKTNTNEWLVLDLNNPHRGRNPKMRIYRSGSTSYGVGGAYAAVPYDQMDAAETFNPSDEWFSIDAAGLSASRRIIVNKDGEYLMMANFITTLAQSGQAYIRIVKMTGNNVIGNTLASNSGYLVLHNSTRARLSAGESVGVAVYGSSSYSDAADSASGNRNDFSITRVGD